MNRLLLILAFIAGLLASTSLHAAPKKAAAPAKPAATASVTPPVKMELIQEKNANCLDGIKFSFDTVFHSHYWGSIVGGRFYGGGAVNFSTITASKDDVYGSTYVYAGMINPLDTLKYDHLGGTEYYIALGRTLGFWKDDEGTPGLKITVEILYDAVTKITEIDDDLIQGYLRVELPRFPIVMPYAEFYPWGAVGDDTLTVGEFYRVGIHRDQPLGFEFNGEEVVFSFDFSAGWGTEGLFGTSDGLSYYRLKVNTTLQLNEKWRMTPYFLYQWHGDQEIGRAFVPEDGLEFGVGFGIKW